MLDFAWSIFFYQESFYFHESLHPEVNANATRQLEAVIQLLSLIAQSHLSTKITSPAV